MTDEQQRVATWIDIKASHSRQRTWWRDEIWTFVEQGRVCWEKPLSCSRLITYKKTMMMMMMIMTTTNSYISWVSYLLLPHSSVFSSATGKVLQQQPSSWSFFFFLWFQHQKCSSSQVIWSQPPWVLQLKLRKWWNEWTVSLRLSDQATSMQNDDYVNTDQDSIKEWAGNSRMNRHDEKIPQDLG